MRCCGTVGWRREWRGGEPRKPLTVGRLASYLPLRINLNDINGGAAGNGAGLSGHEARQGCGRTDHNHEQGTLD